MGVANAQQNDQAAGQTQQTRGDQRNQVSPPQEFRGQPGQEMRPDMQQRMGMMGGGQATMVTDNAFLYILQGNTLYKVNKNNLEVIGQGQLPMPMRDPRFEGGPQPGAPGVRGGGDPGVRSGGGGGGAARTTGGDETAK
jgi:hypothetical protein